MDHKFMKALSYDKTYEDYLEFCTTNNLTPVSEEFLFKSCFNLALGKIIDNFDEKTGYALDEKCLLGLFKYNESITLVVFIKDELEKQQEEENKLLKEEQNNDK